MRVDEIKKQLLEENSELDLRFKRDLSYHISDHIEQARLAKGLTQKELADKIGTQQSNIARAENNKSLPSLTFLQRMAKAFDSYLIPPRFAFMETRKPYATTETVNVIETRMWGMGTVGNKLSTHSLASHVLGAYSSSNPETSQETAQASYSN
ncbi:MAG: helix-turn-helix transcriptional regulator [Patescibacteria group bacterium]|nr:helix-turn-helix transcriptional regulator [Patescibacteria group bacterium]